MYKISNRVAWETGRYAVLFLVIFMSSIFCAPGEADSVVQLSPMAPAPDWSALDPYQETITKAEFEHLLQTIYCPDGALNPYITTSDKACMVYSDPGHTHAVFQLRFAASDSSARPVPATYHKVAFSTDPIRPLKGIRIALDPGHIGGDWARVEERYFRIGDDPPVEEAQLNELTCSILAELLEADGADVVWVKHGLHPTTEKRAEDLQDVARDWLGQLHLPVTAASLKYRSNLLFYRVAEIRARADIQHKLHPDLTICVHYNADDWGNPDHPTLTDHSRLVIFMNGSYERGELRNDDVKWDLLRKLLSRTAASELKGCEKVGAQMMKTLGYPAEAFGAYFSHQVGPVLSVHSRNLIASRIYDGPVIYCEGPYMNAKDAYYRIIAGDYLGTREIHGQKVPSIYRQYATSVERGIREYFGLSP